MKKIKSIVALGAFLMAFFVLGMQSANAQYQSATDAYQTLKVENSTLTVKSIYSPEQNQTMAELKAQLSVTKRFISEMSKALGAPNATTSSAIDAVYNDLSEGVTHPSRIALINEAKQYVQDLLQ